MKFFLSLLLVFSLFVIASSFQPAIRRAAHQRPPDSIITSHKWTLVQTYHFEKDTATNTTAILLPCEKDNLHQYNPDGTYQVFSGTNKCQPNESEVMASGEWKYSAADSLLVEKYGDGRPIEKKIILLNDEVLKISYASTANSREELTFFSEVGLKDEEIKDQIVDNSDQAQNIMQLIKLQLEPTNRYITIKRKELGSLVNADDKDGLLPTVAYFPILNSSTNNGMTNMKEYRQTIAAQVKTAGIDYAITGHLISLSSNITNSSQPQFNITFEICILNQVTGEWSSKIFSRSNNQTAPANRTRVRRILGRIMSRASEILPQVAEGILPWALQDEKIWKMYPLLFKADAAMNSLSVANNIYSAIDPEKRKQHLTQTTSISNLLSGLANEIAEFLSVCMPIAVPINKIEGNGKKATMDIEAGNNISLQKDELLRIGYYTQTILSTGKQIKEFKEIGRVAVVEVRNENISSCRFKDNREDIMKAWEKKEYKIIALTTLDSTED